MLHRAGMRATRQRIALAALLARRVRPMSIAQMSKYLPSLDTVTLYRTIESFRRAGIVREVDLRGRAALYEIDNGDHHHLVCTTCDRVEDFHDRSHELIERRILARSRTFSSITSHSFELFGLCNSCAIR